jgi:hypothetical protein
VSLSTLALSVNDSGSYAALTGHARTLTITNTGSDVALDVNYSLSPALPANTSISASTCAGTALPAGASCSITVTPGNVPSAVAGDLNPVPVTVTIAGSNTNTLTPAIHVLTYGSVYQGGYIFAVDDNTPATESIGGKVAALTDQSAAIIWASDGGSFGDFNSILGIDQTSTTISPSPVSPAYPVGTPTYTACNGANDGACNSANIVSYYNFNRVTGGSAPTPANLYAAGLCTATINGYSDWHLPAVCEMGYDRLSNGTGCGSSNSPTTQNMQSNLVDNGNIGALSGNYWSSTEFSIAPDIYAFIQVFGAGGSDYQDVGVKITSVQARCTRLITD